MSAETHNESPPEPVAVHEPARRGSIILVLLVAAALVGAAVALMTLGRTHAQPYILGLLALLAMWGCSTCSPLPPESSASPTAPPTIPSSAASRTLPMMGSRSPTREGTWYIPMLRT